MDRFSFQLVTDGPVAFALLALFLIHFRWYAGSSTSETNVDLTTRLSSASLRIVCFIAALFAFCWTINVAVWAVAGLIFLGGSLLAVVQWDNPVSGGWGMLLTAGYVIREACFGWPEIILHPRPMTGDEDKQLREQSELVGQNGHVTSPLRPTGDVEVDGNSFSASSETGELIDRGTKIIVSGVRNGRVVVRVVDESVADGIQKW